MTDGGLIHVEFFDPHSASRAAWTEYHAYRRRRAEEEEPGEPIPDDDHFEHDACHPWPLSVGRRLTARVEGRLVGNLGFNVRREGTDDYAAFAPFVWGWGGVLAPHRRQGVATALLRSLLAFMRDHGQTMLTFNTHSPDGHGFLTAIGAVEKHRSFENRLNFANLDWNMVAEWEAAAIPAALRWEIHVGRIPMDRLAALLPQFSSLLQQIPLDSLDVPPLRWEMPGIVAWYEELGRYGGEHFLVLLTDGDTIAAMCEASWDARFPDRAYQALTAVAAPWRGQGLAKAVKAAMLRLLRDRHPRLRLLTTSNAEVNAPMLSINTRLGFTVSRRDSTYQIGRDTLGSWLAARRHD